MNQSDPREEAIFLLNCKRCDDILRASDENPRVCLCMQSAVRMVSGRPVISGPSRLLRIEFEDYDGAATGLRRTWKVV